MMLDAKFQLKPGQSVAFVNNNFSLAFKAEKGSPAKANTVVVFAVLEKDLKKQIPTLRKIAKRGSVPWIAYPKAKQLETDLNRDIIHLQMKSAKLKTVRQIAINDTWSALRLKLEID